MSNLNIKNLKVNLNEKNILNEFNLNINLGEKHVIMGPNGVGKSTLAKILSGNYNEYKIEGDIYYGEKNIFSLKPHELSLNGIFLTFQHPIEIPGLSNFQFFKSFINSKRKHDNLNPVNNNDFLIKIKKLMKELKINENLLHRYVNFGFSGGEKKRNEILQMLLLDPNFVIFDEIDSGLDVDSLKIVFNSINNFFNKKKSFLIITHYSRILDYINVDYVHIMDKGKIIKTGQKDLALEVNKKGYNF